VYSGAIGSGRPVPQWRVSVFAMKPTLFIGDINVDIMMGGLESFPIPDREVSCASFDVALGSSAVIAACTFAALGGQSAFLGLAGRDAYGDFMLDGMKDFGIDVSLVVRTDKVKTGVTVNLIHGGQRTQVTYGGTIPELDGAPINKNTFVGLGHVHFAGPYLQTKLRPHVTRLLKTARECGLTTSLDPQWDATEKWKFIDEWLPLLDYFFPNSDEARSITKSATAEDACLKLSARTRRVVVKVGKDGAMLADGGSLVTVRPPQIKIVDTTGAGDALDSGFLYAIQVRQMPLRDALRFAVATASRSCTFVGGTAARSSYDDVMQFMKEKM
jgi:sugar/nucleoside kinase (ribokinase family)